MLVNELYPFLPVKPAATPAAREEGMAKTRPWV
jgi:hypothetical protein